VGFTPGQALGGIQVGLGAVQLGVVDDAGVAWGIGADGLQGWDSAEVRTQITQREADHGAWQGPVYLGERPITLAGTLTAPDQATLDGAIEQLLAAAALGDTTLTVYETIPKQCIVRRSGKPIIGRVTDRIATYSLMVTAGDPRRYSTEQGSGSTALPSTTGGLVLPATVPWTMSATTVAGNIGILNEGSFATRPLYVVNGPVVQPQIATLYPDGSLALLAYSDTLNSGDELVIDTDAHTVMLNEVASRRRYLSGNWPEIPAGGSVSVQFRAAVYNSAALLTATWRSAWI
jgi:hypothetical protein